MRKTSRGKGDSAPWQEPGLFLPRLRRPRRDPRRPVPSPSQAAPPPPRSPHRRHGLGDPARDRCPLLRAAVPALATGSGRAGLASWRLQTQEPAKGCSGQLGSAPLCWLSSAQPRSTVCGLARSALFGPTRSRSSACLVPLGTVASARSVPLGSARPLSVVSAQERSVLLDPLRPARSQVTTCPEGLDPAARRTSARREGRAGRGRAESAPSQA